MKNNTLLTFNEWEDLYGAITEFDWQLNEDTGQLLTYETYEPELSDLQEYAEEIAEDYDSKPYQHIWTIVDGDNGKLIMLNGWHMCNRINYCLSSSPWGDGTNNDKDIYIEVKYEEE